MERAGAWIAEKRPGMTRARKSNGKAVRVKAMRLPQERSAVSAYQSDRCGRHGPASSSRQTGHAATVCACACAERSRVEIPRASRGRAPASVSRPAKASRLEKPRHMTRLSRRSASVLANLGDETFAIARGERIAQLVVQRVERAELGRRTASLRPSAAMVGSAQRHPKRAASKARKVRGGNRATIAFEHYDALSSADCNG